MLQGDITTLRIDAIVNAANEQLRGGGGVDGAVHRVAGPELLDELRTYSSCPTGQAVLTKGYRLPATFVIHAVGPVWRGGRADEPRLLAMAYQSSFALARERPDIRSIAFPAISTGAYGYPKADAARIAVTAMREHEGAFDRVIACLFDDESRAVYERLVGLPS